MMNLHNEAVRLLTVYLEHKDNPDIDMRRRAPIALDRFLMENREEVIKVFIEATDAKKRPWYRRIFNAKNNTKVDRRETHNIKA